MPETIDTLNNRLRDFYGVFHDTSQQNWRLVWSNDQFETRYGTYAKYAENGTTYLGEETGYKLVPKYKQYAPDCFILERVVPVPEGSDLTTKTSYEPVWTFRIGQWPDWDVCKLLIEQLLEQAYQFQKGNKQKKYYEDLMDKNNKEGIEARVNAYKKLLFDDDKVSDALHYGDGVTVPNKTFADSLITITDQDNIKDSKDVTH